MKGFNSDQRHFSLSSSSWCQKALRTHLSSHSALESLPNSGRTQVLEALGLCVSRY